jgi:hypothetical protein
VFPLDPILASPAEVSAIAGKKKIQMFLPGFELRLTSQLINILWITLIV